ncbi:Uncharacterized conserved protein, DUF1499 family [Pseudidiomarina planktonica]|uniref:Uncharacterized conserved protein, DUF1499 family n=1 Tax=Pseudidiomarina planktonica TaxID=1323738 RepID=A0A1Y6G1M1_9GAMM|nr:DUF1499 domain-containing protein [Pseudidiomarina planktonica]RUO63291.1 DUF1499 domain-containing protein [Pseudidiomarina planktonica]SMQ80491.1 Uncharacterized conserved protein, DUF1499 family [Pseudidiomarina planktonica]
MKKIIGWILIFAGLLALLALALAGPAYKYNVADLSAAFLTMRYAAYVGAGAAVLIILYFIFARPRAGMSVLLILSLVAGGISFYLPYAQLQTAQSVPPIHDISTDTENPPEFITIAPLRADAPNPVEYAGPETAAQQQEAYPDLEPMRHDLPANEIFEEALMVVQEMGWELVDSDIVSGRIEATDTTRWFGFKDDVVIRISQEATGSVIDVRSKSRVGRSDVGVNAKRIEAFLDRLKTRLKQSS